MESPTDGWTIGRRVAFRFVFLYFGLYYFPFPLYVVASLGQLVPPLSWIGASAGWLQGHLEHGQSALALWTGTRVLGLSPDAMPIQATGSGDTMIAWVQVFAGFLLAGIGTLVWSLADRRRRGYPRLSSGLHVYLRYALAAILLSYGFAKVPPMQFPQPGPELLVQTYGDSSPMGLLWRFMGFSPVYTMFAGLAEILPGLLLLFRRTAMLGALLAAATLTNVVMVNFCYDVPVKQYSAHLLLTAIVLLVPDLPRLAAFFLRDRPTTTAGFRGARAWAKAAFLAVLLGGAAIGAYTNWRQYGPRAARPALYGVWEVDSFALDGETRPPLLTDTARWRRFLVSRWGGAIVEQMGQQVNRFTLTHDEAAGTIVLASRGEPDTFTLTCARPETGRLVLEGPFREGRVRVELRRAADAAFPIQTRGFHWVQEFPHNR